MDVRYIEFNGKHPRGEKENRVYFDQPKPTWKNYGCSYSSEFLKVDIDDYSHKTGEVEEPVRGIPRSEAVIAILDAMEIRYNGIRTEHGKHLFFRKPSTMEAKNKQNWFCSLGIKCEWKFPTSDDHIPLMINGVERVFFKGSINNSDVDELPFFLLPLQKSKDKPFDLTFPEGGRTQKLCAYLFHLTKKGYSAEQAFQIVRLMNQYIFEKPIPEDTLNAEILNDKTLANLKDNQKQATPTHSEVAHEIASTFGIITVNGQLYGYEHGVYLPFDESRITEYLTTMRPKLNGNFEKEVLRHIKGITRREALEDDGTINVRNGILSYDQETFLLLPHSEENVSFRQFNACYVPGMVHELLNETLLQWFNDDSAQIELFKQMLGYLMMNHVRYQKVFFFIGAPSTGKSTLLKLITAFCGKNNVSAIQFADMSQTHGLSAIVNKTANIFSDVKKGKVFASEVFKMLADGSPVQINAKYKQPYTYSYTGKLLFGMNSFPDFSHDFDGIERRVVVFRFNRVFKKDSPDFNPALLEELTSEESLSALLNMALEGYKSLIANKGFVTTKESESALKDFVSENDNVLRWLDEENIDEEHLLHEPIRLGNNGLYPDYRAFCFGIGETPKEQKDFSRTIIQRMGFSGTGVRRVQGERPYFFRK